MLGVDSGCFRFTIIRAYASYRSSLPLASSSLVKIDSSTGIDNRESSCLRPRVRNVGNHMRVTDSWTAQFAEPASVRGLWTSAAANRRYSIPETTRTLPPPSVVCSFLLCPALALVVRPLSLVHTSETHTTRPVSCLPSMHENIESGRKTLE